MRALSRILFAAALLSAASPGMPYQSPPGALAVAALPALRLSVGPAQIFQGRDVTLQILVRDARGQPVAALVTVTGGSRPVVRNASHGLAIVIVHVLTPGQVQVQASRPGFAPAHITVPVVPGPPASVVAIKNGLSVLPPRAKPRPARVGTDLFAAYHALTGGRQYASLNLRDGTLVDLNSNTDVLITDPLHQRLTAGELFMEVVHGVASHQVQIGSAVAATRGTRLDMTLDPKTKAATVTVIEGLVQVSNGARNVLVGAGQQTTVVAARPPTPPVRVNLAALLAWVQNVPNTTSRVVPPVLNLPPPRVSTPPPAPVAAAPRITVTGAVAATTWSGGPYLLQGHVDVPAGTTLTIAPGTVVQMAPNAYLTVAGTLTARGLEGTPIVFTSSLAQPKPGSWYALTLTGAGASGSVLDHVQVFYAGQGGEAALFVRGGASPMISTSTFAQAANVGVQVDSGSRPTITGCIFSDTGDAAALLPADDVALFTAAAFGPGEQGVIVQGERLAHDASWPRMDVPMVVRGHLDVPAGTTLTIAPGVVVQMAPNAYLTVEGTLTARGLQATPIVFTSSLAQPKPGSWYALTLSGAGASGSVLDHVQVFYAGQGGEAALFVRGGANPTISTSTFAQAANVGVQVDSGSRPTITGCIFSDTGDAAALLPADDVALFTGATFSRDEGGVAVLGEGLAHDAAWPRMDVPLVVSGHLDVPVGRTLTLAPGTVVQMAPGAYLTVEGTLSARGLEGTPIVFTSSLAQPKPGSWYALTLTGAGASGSVLDHVQVFYAGQGGEAALFVRGGASPMISNSTFAQAANVGVQVDSGSRPMITSCIFSDTGDAAALLPADDVALFTAAAFGPAERMIAVGGEGLSNDAAWPALGLPLVVSGHLDVPAGRTLTLAPGVVAQMAPNAYLTVEGTLTARGLEGTPIVFTSSLRQPKPGSWYALTLTGAGASSSVLDHVQVFYAGQGGGAALFVRGGANPTISTSTFAQAANVGVQVDSGSRPTIISCRFEGDGGAAISLPAADPSHIHDNTFGPGQQGIQVRG